MDSEVILFLSFKLLSLILVNLARNIYTAATSNYVKIPQVSLHWAMKTTFLEDVGKSVLLSK